VGEQFNLDVGESTTIGLAIDTEGVEVGETISTTFTIKAERGSDPIPPTLINGTADPTAAAASVSWVRLSSSWASRVT
jgi:hypothetical protein